MKAILVIDMPKDCDECSLNSNGYCDVLQEYALLNEWIENAPYYSLKEKGSCPLKPMPQHKKTNFNDCMEIYNLKVGFNHCLDEILGEEE